MHSAIYLFPGLFWYEQWGRVRVGHRNMQGLHHQSTKGLGQAEKSGQETHTAQTKAAGT